MNRNAQIKSLLKKSIHIPKEKQAVFYKTGAGHYAEHDQFIGVNVPTLRKIAKEFSNLSLEEIQKLIESPINEERLLALFILIIQYQEGTNDTKNIIYQFYVDNLRHVNNWNLVDASAHLIMGAHLSNADRKILVSLTTSEIMWKRRIAIVSTWYFIRNNDLDWTFKLAKMLLNDSQDLIHKATGWMLREAGKRDKDRLIAFLNQHAAHMPRTMLRYSIEKFSSEERKVYL